MGVQIGKCKITASTLGVGTAPLGNMYAQLSDEDVWGCLEAAWDAGVRVFDTAPFYGYGMAEHRLGDFLRTKPRDEYLLSTKTGRVMLPRRNDPPTNDFFLSNYPFNFNFDYSYDGAMRSFEDSLQRLGLDRIDILLIHDTGVPEHGEDQPKVFQQAMEGAAVAMAKLRDEGVIGAIGMGLNEWEVAQAGLEAFDFDTFLLAGRYTLLEQFSAETFLPLCEQRGIQIMLGGVFNSGLLVADDTASATYNYFPAPQELIDKTLAIKAVCQRHGVPLPAAALQFANAHPAVGVTLFGTRNRHESESATNWMQLAIPAELWAELKAENLLNEELPVPS